MIRAFMRPSSVSRRDVQGRYARPLAGHCQWPEARGGSEEAPGRRIGQHRRARAGAHRSTLAKHLSITSFILLQFVQTKYTLGEDVHNDPFHADIIRDKLARGLPAVLPDVIDELTVATREHIPTEGDGVYS